VFASNTIWVLILALMDYPSTRVEIEVGRWFNPPSVRIPDERTYVLFFFSTVDERSNAPWIKKLNTLRSRADLAVLALTPESEERVSRFVEAKKVRFPVAAKCNAYKRFRIKEFPKLIVMPPHQSERNDNTDPLDFDAFDRRFSGEPESERLVSAAFSDDAPIDVLRDHARLDPVEAESHRALRLLRTRQAPDEFMALCDELLGSESNLRRRADIEYERHLANPAIADKEPLLAPASEALHAIRQTPDDPQWKPLQEYRERVASRTPDELLEDYLEHSSTAPADLLIRRTIPPTIGESADKARAREILVQMLRAEQDAVIRMNIVYTLATVCQPGDIEIAEFLEDQLRTEKNIRVARPAFEYVIRYLRTGEE